MCGLSAFLVFVLVVSSIVLSGYLIRQGRGGRLNVAGWVLAGVAAGGILGALFGVGAIVWNLTLLHKL